MYKLLHTTNSQKADEVTEKLDRYDISYGRYQSDGLTRVMINERDIDRARQLLTPNKAEGLIFWSFDFMSELRLSGATFSKKQISFINEKCKK
jgi:hypothetical protein